jgi:hypothetical protein
MCAFRAVYDVGAEFEEPLLDYVRHA